MGSFLIPNAASVHEAADFIGEPPLTASWGYAPGGVRFTDTARTDVECQALYVGYVPSGVTDDAYRKPPPQEVQDAIDTLRGFYQQNPSVITSVQSAQLHRAEVVILRYHHQEIG